VNLLEHMIRDLIDSYSGNWIIQRVNLLEHMIRDLIDSYRGNPDHSTRESSRTHDQGPYR